MNVQAKPDVYGKGVTLTEATAVSAILDNPDTYLGKMVRVEGMIIEVCAKRGCWMYVAGDRQGDPGKLYELCGQGPLHHRRDRLRAAGTALRR